MALLGYHALATFGGYVVLRAERGEPAAFDRTQAALLIRETAARALNSLMQPFGWTSPRPSLTVKPGGTPVVLVPGIRRNRSSMQFLEIYLHNRGFAAHAVNHGGEPGLAQLAEVLQQQVEDTCKATGAERVDLVGHSFGGLVAAWYVKHLGGDDRVRRLITVGAPFGGTKMAVFGRRAVHHELLPGSPLLESLAPLPVPTVCIWSPDDPVIVPSRAAVADGAESVRIDGSGHVDMLCSSRVFRAVQAALSDMAEVS